MGGEDVVGVRDGLDDAHGGEPGAVREAEGVEPPALRGSGGGHGDEQAGGRVDAADDPAGACRRVGPEHDRR